MRLGSTQQKPTRVGRNQIKGAKESEMAEWRDLTLYDFEYRDNAFGTTYGVALLHKFFPDAFHLKGMSVYQTPIGKVVVTCKKIVLIQNRHRKAMEWMALNNLA